VPVEGGDLPRLQRLVASLVVEIGRMITLSSFASFPSSSGCAELDLLAIVHDENLNGRCRSDLEAYEPVALNVRRSASLVGAVLLHRRGALHCERLDHERREEHGPKTRVSLTTILYLPTVLQLWKNGADRFATSFF